MLKRLIPTIFIILGLLALSFTPVFAGGGSEKAASTGTAIPTTPATLTCWTGYAEFLPTWKMAADDYSKEHPNIKFDFANFSLREEEQKLQVSMAGGTPPDMSDLGSQLTLRNGDQAYLDPVPAAYMDWVKQNYDPVYTDALSIDGKLFGIPYIQGYQVLYYNLDDFAAAGITKPPATLDELMDTAKKLTKYDANGKVTHAGISLRLSGQGSGIAEKWEIFLMANGAQVLVPNGKNKWKPGFNNDAGYKALNFYLQALYKNKVDSFDVQHDSAAFVAGVASMFNRETNVIGMMAQQAPTKKYGIAQPVGDSSRGTNLNVGAVVVPAGGKNKAVTWDFLKYLEADKYAVNMMSDAGWIYNRKNVNYSPVFAKEPHFQQAIDRPAGFKLYVSQPATSWAEVFTNLANALTVAFTDQSLMDNKTKIMAWLQAQEDAAVKVLKANNEF